MVTRALDPKDMGLTSDSTTYSSFTVKMTSKL